MNKALDSYVIRGKSNKEKQDTSFLVLAKPLLHDWGVTPNTTCSFHLHTRVSSTDFYNHHMKGLLNSFHLNGHTLGFHSQM